MHNISSTVRDISLAFWNSLWSNLQIADTFVSVIRRRFGVFLIPRIFPTRYCPQYGASPALQVPWEPHFLCERTTGFFLPFKEVFQRSEGPFLQDCLSLQVSFGISLYCLAGKPSSKSSRLSNNPPEGAQRSRIISRVLPLIPFECESQGLQLQRPPDA